MARGFDGVSETKSILEYEKSSCCMNKPIILGLCVSALLLCGIKAFTQPSSKNFDKVWVQGESMTYTTTFITGQPPVNQLIDSFNTRYFAFGNSNICDSFGNLLLVSDGYNLYDGKLNLLDSGAHLVPPEIFVDEDGFSQYPQSSIILPFGNGKYRLITPT